MTRSQPQTFKILKFLGNETKDNLRLNIISNDTWLNYYQNLWGPNTIPLLVENSANLDEELITLEELEMALKNMKSNKVPGEDGLNIDLFKYSSKNFQL